MLPKAGIGDFFHKLRLPGRNEINEFIAWAREHAVVFEPLDGMNADIEKLSFLDALLENKKVIFLGEEDHWIHEKNEYRLLMLRYFFSRGWRYVGEELAWSDGIRIDRYLETGDLSELDRIATYGYRGDVRKDRESKATGILKDASDNYPSKEFKAEQIRLEKAVRKINEGYTSAHEKIHFFGFDVNAVSESGYRDISELLKPACGETVVAELQSLLRRIPGEALEQEILRLDHALEKLGKEEDSLSGILGAKCYAKLCRCILNIRDSYEYFRIANPARNYAEMNVAMAAREEVMHRNVKFVLSQMGQNDKLILMGHNRHLSKNIGAIKKAGASPPGGKRVPSLGTFINSLLPGQVFSIWMLYDHGRSSQPFTWLSNEYSGTPGSLNAILAEVGTNYLLATASNDSRIRLLGKYMDIAGIYNAIFRARVAEQADAVFFANEVSPLRDTEF